MLERRDFVKKCAGMGFAGTLLPGVLWAQAQAGGAEKITREMIESAADYFDKSDGCGALLEKIKLTLQGSGVQGEVNFK